MNTGRPELPKHYDPAEAEPRLYRRSLEAGVFHEDPDPARPPFIISMPPPNITGRAHLGHGSTYTTMDVLTRYHRMRGYRTLWQMGSDHAGAISITPMSEADRKIVARMWTALFYSHDAAGGSGSFVGSRLRLRREVQVWINVAIRSPDHVGLVLKEHGMTRGFITLGINMHPWLSSRRSATITAIWVEARARRRGFGRRLVVAVLRKLATSNVDAVNVQALSVTPGSALFWRSMGFSDFAVQMRLQIGTGF